MTGPPHYRRSVFGPRASGQRESVTPRDQYEKTRFSGTHERTKAVVRTPDESDETTC